MLLGDLSPYDIAFGATRGAIPHTVRNSSLGEERLSQVPTGLWQENSSQQVKVTRVSLGYQENVKLVHAFCINKWIKQIK